MEKVPSNSSTSLRNAHRIGEPPVILMRIGEGEPTTAINPDDLLMPYKSSLALTRDQAMQLAKDTEDDYNAVKKGMDDGWRPRRKRWLAMHEQDYSHRVTAKTDETNIFNHSNVSLDICKGDALRSSGRLQRELIDTWPYFGLVPTGYRGTEAGLKDGQLARDMEHFAYFKVKNSNLSSCLASGLDIASVLGEAVVKTTYRKISDTYDTRAEVLCNPAGEPYRTSEGDVIYRSDSWTTEPPPPAPMPAPGIPCAPLDPAMVAPVEPVEAPAPAPITGEPSPGIHLLVKDLSFVFPVDGIWTKKLVTAEMVHYDNASSEVVYYENFHAPLNVPDLKMARGIYFDLSLRMSTLRTQYGITEDKKTVVSSVDDLKETKTWRESLFQWVRNAVTGDGSPKSAIDTPNPLDGEGYNHKSLADDAEVRIVEGYRMIDLRGTGTPQRIYVVMDMDKHELLWWDFVANMTPDGLPPVEVIRKREKRHRWYGIGDYEEGEPDCEQCDYFVNRAIHGSSYAGQIAGYDPSACDDWQSEPPRVGKKEFYKLKTDRDMKEAVTFADMPQDPGRCHGVFQLAPAKAHPE